MEDTLKKLQRKLKHIFHVRNLFPKIVQFIRHVEKYGGAGQATDDNIIRRGRGN